MTRELGAAGRRARAHRFSRARLRAPARTALGLGGGALLVLFCAAARAAVTHATNRGGARGGQASQAGPAAARPARAGGQQSQTQSAKRPESRDEKVQSRHARDSRSEQSQLFSCSFCVVFSDGPDCR